MRSLFDLLFACCLRSQPSSELPPDQRPLIQNGGQTPTYAPRDTASSDRQKVKERLGNIVRSKESKMVNVTDHLPFNLQNRDAPVASTSRLRTESPSPHPSVGTAETTTSRSGSSLRPRGGRFGPPKEPALSVRLIRGRDGNYRGSTSRGRLGRFGEERGVEWTREGEDNGSGNPEGVPRLHVSDPDAAPPEIVPLQDVDREIILALSVGIGRQLRDGWKIEDTGSISRGWGD
ncbi:hypothetical protein K439DRAFT_1639237 [Ramaria rubella]|nr:hypothetical protein K439DRAFT_1639237 [Ramaria rubella]